jgi:hypothetical protein
VDRRLRLRPPRRGRHASSARLTGRRPLPRTARSPCCRSSPGRTRWRRIPNRFQCSAPIG